MAPTLVDGDRVLAWWGPVSQGSVVVAVFVSRPELLVIKRVRRRCPGGWEVSSDNSGAGTDSATLGTARVLAVGYLRFRGPLGRQIDRSGHSLLPNRLSRIQPPE